MEIAYSSPSKKRRNVSSHYSFSKRFRPTAFAAFIIFWTVFLCIQLHQYLAQGVLSDALLQSQHIGKGNEERMMHYSRVVFEPDEKEGKYRKTQPKDDKQRHPSQRFVSWLGDKERQQKITENDRPPLKEADKDCTLRYDWQKTTHPTCNMLHEFDLSTHWSSRGERRQERYRLIDNGYWRDIWVVNDQFGEKEVLKSMRWEHDYTHRNFERMRIDALTMERLTKSKFSIDIYSFCATSSISEYGDDGDIPATIWPENKMDQSELTQIEKLRIATQAAMGLAALHNIDKENESSIAHTDISPNQYIKVDGIYKLNDYNRARFLRWSSKSNTACAYYVGSNPGKNRSPEEYNHDPQSEMVDVYSFGNILYMLLEKKWAFEDISEREVRKLVKKGHRPSFSIGIWNSTDPVDVALKEAMLKCHEQDPGDRASAREIETFLKAKMRELDPGQIDRWGVS